MHTGDNQKIRNIMHIYYNIIVCLNRRYCLRLKMKRPNNGYESITRPVATWYFEKKKLHTGLHLGSQVGTHIVL